MATFMPTYTSFFVYAGIAVKFIVLSELKGISNESNL